MLTRNVCALDKREVTLQYTFVIRRPIHLFYSEKTDLGKKTVKARRKERSENDRCSNGPSFFPGISLFHPEFWNMCFGKPKQRLPFRVSIAHVREYLYVYMYTYGGEKEGKVARSSHYLLACFCFRANHRRYRFDKASFRKHVRCSDVFGTVRSE